MKAGVKKLPSPFSNICSLFFWNFYLFSMFTAILLKEVAAILLCDKIDANGSLWPQSQLQFFFLINWTIFHRQHGAAKKRVCFIERILYTPYRSHTSRKLSLLFLLPRVFLAAKNGAPLQLLSFF
jgi:hypothetical protein